IVDDPFDFGQIAAANSLSDVYAMGGRPLTALSVVAFPERDDPALLEQILRGGMAKMAEAGCTVVGGHSIRDAELKFGFAVTGTVNPKKVWANAGARPGDRLLLTKPLGTGVITTALKHGAAKESWVAAATKAMAELNRVAAEALASVEGGVHAATDVTGFGLLGHARELALASGVSLVLDSRQVAFLEGALECARGGHLAGGLKSNREFLSACVEFAPDVSPEIENLFYDPQTSGGLLAAVAREKVDATRQALLAAGCAAMLIGEVVAKTSPLIAVQ
ncbi:MAG: selenide, water dikinase SelD, partial [Candidatus Acidiferrales bacterium]